MSENTMQGTIQQAASAAPKGALVRPIDNLRKHLSEEGVQAQVKRVYGEHADLFTASVIELFNNDAYLQKCPTNKIVMEALKAASMQLPINKALGHAYIVPYGDVPTLVIGHHGYKQLAQRSGQYAGMNEGAVYEGELKKYDKLTGELDISGEATSDKVVGYFSWFRLLNGFQHAIYWTKEKVIAHAKHYSKSYNRDGSAWQTAFDAMAKKTVFLQNIRGWGPLSIEMQKAFMTEEDQSTPDDENTIDGEATVVE